MAYVLGFIYADGSLENSPYLRGKYLRITSTDKEIILNIKKWLCSAHTVVIKKPSYPKGKKCFFLRIGSHRIYDSLSSHGLYPNKSLTIKFPRHIPKEFLWDFIRGYFDGDGCISLATKKGINKPVVTKKLTMSFTSGSKEFLEDLSSLISKSTSVKVKKVYDSHYSFQLCYSTSDSLELFKHLYRMVTRGYYFQRKFDIFANYFSLQPNRVDKSTKEILECLSRGHVVK